jgi:hypothetical protein
MATRNIVPRATGEGNIGTSLKKWLKGWFGTVHTTDITDGTYTRTVAAIDAFIASKHAVSGLASLSAGSKVVEDADTVDTKHAADFATAAQGSTADAALPKAGGTMAGDITLGENTALAVDPSGSADEKWSGITVSGTAGATIAVGELCYIDVTTTEWKLAKADAVVTSGPVVLGLCILAAGDGQATKMLLLGTMRSAKFPASIALGAPVHISGATAGAIVAAQPTTTDYVIRVVGFAITAEPNTIYFCPSPDYITHT